MSTVYIVILNIRSCGLRVDSYFMLSCNPILLNVLRKSRDALYEMNELKSFSSQILESECAAFFIGSFARDERI